jgi:hypothetical protein
VEPATCALHRVEPDLGERTSGRQHASVGHDYAGGGAPDRPLRRVGGDRERFDQWHRDHDPPDVACGAWSVELTMPPPLPELSPEPDVEPEVEPVVELSLDTPLAALWCASAYATPANPIAPAIAATVNPLVTPRIRRKPTSRGTLPARPPLSVMRQDWGGMLTATSVAAVGRLCAPVRSR